MSQIKNGVQKVKESVLGFVKEEDGVGVVEIVLICVVLVALVVIFKDSVTDIVNNALDSVEDDADGIYE